MVTQDDIASGLRRLGLGSGSTVIVHSSLRSFGNVEGGAEAVCRALVATCGTVLIPAASGDLTAVPAPPGLVRPHNAYYNADSWEQFDTLLARATPFAHGLPIDRELGRIPETMRRVFAHARSAHPLASYLAVGEHAETLITAQRLDHPLGPLDALERIGGHVLLLGVGHTVNTAIHLAEQRLGRSRFYRYARAADGVWMELPNVPGESHRFEEIEPALGWTTRETLIGDCRARLVAVADVTAAARRLIVADPGALLCDDPACRCAAALQQRLAHMRRDAGAE